MTTVRRLLTETRGAGILLKSMKRVFKEKIQIFLIVFITFLAYCVSFQNDFVLDDFDFIVNWQQTRSFTNIFHLLLGSVPVGHEGVYRPLRSIFYLLSFQLGQLHLLWYHFQAIAVHITCTLFVYLIISEMVKINLFKKILGKEYIPFLGALLFGLHPVHVEEITYITASFDTIGIAFFYLSFYLYLVSRRKKIHKKLFLALSITSAIVAYFTYEMTLILPILIILFELCCKKKVKIILSKWKEYAGYFIGFFVYALIRIAFLHILNRGTWIGGNIYSTFLIMTKVFVQYLLLLFLPIHLSLVHMVTPDIPTLGIPDIKENMLKHVSLLNFDVIAGSLLIFILIWLSVRCLKRFPFISFAIGWFFISLLPVSQIIPLQVVMGEKYLYIASFGYCFIVAVFFGYLFKRFFRYRAIVLLLFTLLSGFYFFQTVVRNTDWKTSLTIWQDTAKISPQSATAHYNTAILLQNEQSTKNAIEEYQKALNIDPTFDPAASNLAFLYLDSDNVQKAQDLFEKALRAHPGFYPMEYGLGQVFLKEGKPNEAIQAFTNALKNNPGFSPAKERLAVLQNKNSFHGLGIEFSYPEGWTVNLASQTGVVIEKKLAFQIFLEVKENSEPFQSVIDKDMAQYGKPVNQGNAEVPHFDFAYVKIWQNQDKKIMEFFLFKDSHVLKVLVEPSDSPLMRVFDEIMNSVRFDQ